MTLREELPQRTQDPGFSRINNALHDEIAAQIEAFMRNGGRINEVPAGASGEDKSGPNFSGGRNYTVDNDGELVMLKNDAYEKNRKRARKHKQITDNTPLGMFPKPPKKIKVRSNTGHLHISRKQDGTLVVRVLNKQVGTFKKEDLDKALEARNKHYEMIGFTCYD